MEVVEIHVIRLQPIHGGEEVLADVLVYVAALPQKQLGGDDYIVPHVLQRLADNALIVPDAGKIGAIDLRCIEEGTSVLVGVPNGLDAVRFGWDLTVSVGKSHAAHPYLGDLDIS